MTGLWYDRRRVPAITLQSVWDGLPQPLSRVDLLVVDVEGAELLVLSPPLPSPLPSFLYFESSALQPHSLHALTMSLKEQGYRRVRWLSEVRMDLEDWAARSTTGATAPSSHGEGRSTPGEGDELWVHGKSWRPTRDRAKVVRNETCRGSDLRLYKVRDEKGNSLF